MKYISLMLIICVFVIVTERIFPPETTPDMITEAIAFGTERGKEVPTLPFVHDGCTLFPDKLPGLDLAHACYEHDIAYWHGGSSEERKLADTRLKEAAAAQGMFGQIMQLPVYIGVHLFGDTFLTRMFNAHWGFGHE